MSHTPAAGKVMDKAEQEAFQQQLLHLRERLKGDVSHLTTEALGSPGSGNLSQMPIHMADLGSDAFEQENTLNLLANEQQTLEEIGEALDRVSQGTFGSCEECDEAIPKARLKELPWTRYCVACARKVERRNR
jgi:RNA polymerase-binding transcription factor DksA